MSTLRNKLIVLVAMGILAVVGSLMKTPQANAQGGRPNVTIGAPLPLPVSLTGSNTISGTVAATQSGAWSVSSRPDLPASPFGDTPVFSRITVPAGRHLVIETLSIQVDVHPAGTK